MGFTDDLSALGDKFDRKNDVHRRAITARPAASHTIAARFDEVRAFLRQRGIGPYPVVQLPAPHRSDLAQQRWSFKSSRKTPEPPRAPEILDTGWWLPAAFVSIHGGVYSGTNLSGMAGLGVTELTPDVSRSLSLRAGIRGYVLSQIDNAFWHPTAISFDASSIVPISNFGDGDYGRQQYEKFTTEGSANLLSEEIPEEVNRNPNEFFGVTHDGVPVMLQWHHGNGLPSCSIKSLDNALRFSLEYVMKNNAS